MTFLHTLIVGLVATLVMDAWGLARKPLLGMSAPDYRPVGRWVLSMFSGHFVHAGISKATPMRGERIVGWMVHYLTGLVFAAVLLDIAGPEWVRTPTILPALAFGVVTVAVPFFVMQPAMGMGIAASRTAHPGVTRFQSLVTHAVFGIGLYAGGLASAAISPSSVA